MAINFLHNRARIPQKRPEIASIHAKIARKYLTSPKSFPTLSLHRYSLGGESPVSLPVA